VDIDAANHNYSKLGNSGLYWGCIGNYSIVQFGGHDGNIDGDSCLMYSTLSTQYFNIVLGKNT
jgi:hypothetical protein